MRNSRKRQKPSKKKASITELYKEAGIREKVIKKPKNWYINFARRAGKMFKAKNEFKKEEFKLALDFLGWDLQPREVNAAPTLVMVLGFGITIPILFFVAYYSLILGALPYLTLFYVAPVLILLPFLLIFWVQNYPLSAAKAEKMKSITAIPEIVNYLVMSMKLSPNLERAVKFAAEHGRGKIAEDLKKLSWNVNIGKYKSMEEGLDELAYKWGAFSDEFKHSLMLIRSSVIEIDEAKRYVILDKAVSDVLEGIGDDMSKYATEMRQPSIYLYYVGVLLPLLLIIMLPIGAVMAKLPIAQTWVLILLYNLAIPIGTIFFAKIILGKRPPVYTPPKIPDDYPGLKKTGPTFVILAIFVAIGVFLVFSYVFEPVLNPIPPEWNTEARRAYFQFFTIAGFVIGIASAISIYLYGTASAKRKIQKRIMEMEDEFQDSIYVVASRLGENRPMEEAMEYTADFLTATKVSGVFRKAADNIRNLGMTVEASLFDPMYGALKNIPSDLIRGSMRIVIDSINLGVQQAARALISLSLQLRDAQRVKEKIRSMLGEITAMMKSIAFLIAPLVLGITSALQKIIVSALRAVGQQPGFQAAGGVGGISIPNIPISSFGDVSMLKGIPDAATFLLIIAIYVIEVTLILIFFTSRIEEGENNLALKMNIAKSLPIATILFFLSAWMAAQMTAIL